MLEELIETLESQKRVEKKTASEAIRAANTLYSAEWFEHFKHRLERAYGNNMTNILTVFPFQAASIPFLQTVLKDYLNTLKGLSEELREMTFYLSIAGFSSMADNYVACKLGLSVYPDRPEIPLSASI